MGMPQMLWNDDVQAQANHFVRRKTKQIGGGFVPDLNHPLSISKDDGVGRLVNHQAENFEFAVADRKAHGDLTLVLALSHPCSLAAPPRRPEGQLRKWLSSNGEPAARSSGLGRFF